MDSTDDKVKVRENALRERNRLIRFSSSVHGNRAHICAFFNSPDDEYRVLLPFIKEGLECGEKAIHTIDPRRRDEHLQRLAMAGIDVTALHRGGQFELRDWTDTHLRDGHFDQGRTLALFAKIRKDARQQGFPLVQFLTHMEWALETELGVDALLEYEAKINEVWLRQDGPVHPVICTYDLSKFGGEIIVDVMRTHPMIIIDGLLQENPFFIPPDEFLRELRERRLAKVDKGAVSISIGTKTEHAGDEAKYFRACINDLASILALPAMWTGQDAARVTTTLLDVVVPMLDLDFAYARTIDPATESSREWMRSADTGNYDADTQEVGRALEPYLFDVTPGEGLRVANPVAEGTVSIAVFPFGVQDSVGVFVAASRRSAFPTETERLLLQVATNQAAIVLQEARRIAQRDAGVETERTRTQAMLQGSEERFRHMADSIPETIRYIIDSTPAHIHTALPDGYIDFFNQTWLEYVGLPLGNIQGWNWTTAIHPEDVEEFVDQWRAALLSGEPFVAESRVRRADGEYRWFLHRKVPLRDELGKIVKWYGSSIEIEERKTAEEKIREQEAELRQILDLTPQHIGVLGPDGSPLYANYAALEYLGVDMDQWRAEFVQLQAGNSWVGSRLELVHPDDRELFLSERKRRFLEGAPHEYEARLRRHDGVFRWFLFRLNPLKDERGQITRWYGTATDIEDRKRAEEGIKKENIALREEIVRTSMFEEIVGSSDALRKVLLQVAKVAPTDSTVLITGETGTGKELVARAIHKRSRRSSRAFVNVNCAAIPASLIASELFGHEKGAFTGALQRRLGRFELAEEGTLFLDEVGELPAETQITLLRVLQEREFERVGGNQRIRANVRVIAATNRDLEAAIAAGTFRSDLFYRLNVFPIEIPPLRERREDIRLLAEYFIDHFARRAGRRFRGIHKKTLDLLLSYPWPGNIRELQNVVERSVIVCETETFSVDESWLSRQPLAGEPTRQLELSHKLAAQEKEIIEAALRESDGRVSGPSGAAAKLGIHRSTLESKIATLKIDKYRFKTTNAAKKS